VARALGLTCGVARVALPESTSLFCASIFRTGLIAPAFARRLWIQKFDIFVRCAAALVLTPVTLPQAPPVELVQSLFDLTPAEARVARGLASGKTVEDIATDGGTSANTIRTHVRGVLEKTGCNRQTDIVALLTAISSTRLTTPV
jgi:DNA-binding CsgD family transcriptional regulator